MMVMTTLTQQLRGCGGAYRALLFLVLLVMVWWIFIRVRAGKDHAERDPMNKLIFEWNWLENCCSLWPISHLVFFAIIAFMYPHCEKVIFLAGVLWELFEVFMNFIFRGTVIKQPMITGESVQYSQVWWAGSLKDVFFNTVGIIIGRSLRLYCVG